MNFPTLDCNIFLTLKCNFNCYYCLTQFDARHDFEHVLQPASRWIPAINSLKNITYLGILGGQPTTHPDFVEIINGIDLPNLTQLAIGSNGSQQAQRALLQVKPRPNLHIQVSFHADEINANDHIAMVQAIKQVHKDVGTQLVGNAKEEAYWAPIFAAAGVPMSCQPLIGRLPGGTFAPESMTARCDGQPHPAMCCTTGTMPVAPNGDIYYCHALLYLKKDMGKVGNILDGWAYDVKSMTCPEVGNCSPCDFSRSLSKPA